MLDFDKLLTTNLQRKEKVSLCYPDPLPPYFSLLFSPQIQYSNLPDPFTFINIFSGLPFNYRKSVLADISLLPAHRLEQLVCCNPASEVRACEALVVMQLVWNNSVYLSLQTWIIDRNIASVIVLQLTSVKLNFDVHTLPVPVPAPFPQLLLPEL